MTPVSARPQRKSSNLLPNLYYVQCVHLKKKVTVLSTLSTRFLDEQWDKLGGFSKSWFSLGSTASGCDVISLGAVLALRVFQSWPSPELRTTGPQHPGRSVSPTLSKCPQLLQPPKHIVICNI